MAPVAHTGQIGAIWRESGHGHVGPPVSHFGTPPKKCGRSQQQTIGPGKLLLCCAIGPQKGCRRMVLNEPFCRRRNKDGTIDSVGTAAF